ncbi:MAG: FkbM family methyltransferase [Anaerolineales bacterium]|nr:FkbM family methyltransferase [Anaerolineales bacterium]
MRTLIYHYCRRIPIRRGKYRLALWAFRHLRPIAPEFRRVPFGHSLSIEVDLAEFIQSQIYYLGLYEYYLARYAQTVMRPGEIFVDVGAHIGQYALLAAERGMEVHAFEPDHVSFAQMRRNMELNRLSATLNCMAVADYEGEATLYPVGGAENRNNSLRPIVPDSTREVIAVPVIKLDAYFKHTPSRIGIIKADVEGAELNVLSGACDVLARHRPTLILEVADHLTRAFGYRPSDLEGFLKKFGYRLHTLDRERLRPMTAIGQISYDNVICLPPEPD